MKLTLYITGQIIEIPLADDTDIDALHVELEKHCLGCGTIIKIPSKEGVYSLVSLHIDGWRFS